ncbi:MAG: 16S rRNA (adenine(1518)-N(6)/adenine(1519)-N(6))-dimethyltransferase RsmA, partial [Bacteroidota bacterium]|nr:16S rRNA (adenine(1518)-N(6)/adenine(1519)-N(6))-dimethyltransferase RsmA [Bacteroidota bacterium]
KIIEKDFLKLDFKKIFRGQFAIIGNFPYNISSQILFKIIDNRDLIVESVGMFQQEVAKRICESPGKKSYGILSVLIQAFYKTEYLFNVSKHVFQPTPKVASGVIRLKRKKKFKLNCDEKLFFLIVKTSFQQRRKILRNSLKSFGISLITKEDSIFEKRPEQLNVYDFVELTSIISNDTFSN